MVRERNVLLIGGGNKPLPALRLFLAQSRVYGDACILVVGWGSQHWEESLQALEQDLRLADATKGGFSLEYSPLAPTSPSEIETLLRDIKNATGVFFMGGDQSALMDGMLQSNVKKAFLKAYSEGKVFGGTSAGTAIMSSRMIYGHTSLERVDPSLVHIRDGLGVLPTSIVDQHFFKRSRHNRLMGALGDHPDHLAFGIDEDSSLMVTNEETAKVIGGQVMVINGASGDSLNVTILNCGDEYDLKARGKLKRAKPDAP